MTRTDTLTGNLIGKGEDTTMKVLTQLTRLPIQEKLSDYPKPGIYRQVPVLMLLDTDQTKDLSDEHKKSSVDIVIVTEEFLKRIICIRVQGKGHGFKLQGILKAKKDSVQKSMLTKHCEVVDIFIRDCKDIFKERFTPNAILEIELSFETQKVRFPYARCL